MDRSDRRLALIELLDRDGHVLQRAEVSAWPATVGRGWDNDLVLDDPHVAARHLSVEPDEQGVMQLRVEPDARNGVRLPSHVLEAGQRAALPRGVFELGSARLRVRWQGEALDDERPYRPRRETRGGGVAALLLWAAVAAEAALALDPGASTPAWLGPMLALPIALGAWAALWGLLSKLFRHRFEYWPHVAIAARWGLAATLLGWLLPRLAFAFDQPWLLVPAALLGLVVAVGMLRAHAMRVLPTHGRAVSVTLVVGALAFVGVQAVNQHQHTDRWIGPLYLSQIGPPWLRLAPTRSVPAFVDEARGLRAVLAERTAADLADEED